MIFQQAMCDYFITERYGEWTEILERNNRDLKNSMDRVCTEHPGSLELAKQQSNKIK